MHVHVRTEEERIALGQQTDIPSCPQMRRENFGTVGVEVVQGATVAARMIGGLDRDRIHQPLFDLIATQIWLGDAPGDAVSVARTVIRDDISLSDDTCGLDRDQLAVTGTESDAPEFSGARLARCVPRLG